ncbi:MAG: hypothetical protein DME16_04240 [Candidatus Rokuibacteriota bacterium]|nr:MAG: hypothetical protein DME16_04240 [Candidatus Rokubacteria bacterium]
MRALRAAALIALATLVALAAFEGRDARVSEVAAQDAAGAGEKPAAGDTFVHASIGDITGLIPNITSDSASHMVGNLIYDGLVQLDKDLNWAPSIAESWHFSKDCLTLTFKLRKNVKWHDGRPFTADDVIFTYKAMMNPKTPTAYRDDFEPVKEVQALDPYTVRVTYAQPFAKALGSWGQSMLPRHLLEKAVEEGKLREAPQNLKPVGTGPYRFHEWKSGEKVVLVANKDYYIEGRPYIGRIVYRIIPSQATIFLELKAKGVDMAELTAIQYERQTDYPAFKKDYNKYHYAANRYTYLGFNLKDERFKDRRVRQAFAHAINKAELIEGVVMGLGREATGPYRPGTWAYTDKVKRYEFRISRPSSGPPSSRNTSSRSASTPSCSAGGRGSTPTSTRCGIPPRTVPTSSTPSPTRTPRSMRCSKRAGPPATSRSAWPPITGSSRSWPRTSRTCSCTSGRPCPWSPHACGASRSSRPASTTTSSTGSCRSRCSGTLRPRWPSSPSAGWCWRSRSSSGSPSSPSSSSSWPRAGPSTTFAARKRGRTPSSFRSSTRSSVSTSPFTSSTGDG